MHDVWCLYLIGSDPFLFKIIVYHRKTGGVESYVAEALKIIAGLRQSLQLVTMSTAVINLHALFSVTSRDEPKVQKNNNFNNKQKVCISIIFFKKKTSTKKDTNNTQTCTSPSKKKRPKSVNYSWLVFSKWYIRR